jgi:hypothetical protein
MTLSSGSNFCYHPCISCQQSIISNPSSMQPTTSNMSYLYTTLAQETGYVLLISPGSWLPLSRVVEKARWLQLEKFKTGCRSKSSRTVQTLPMLTLWCLTLFHKLLYQLPARCNGISLLWPHQVLEHLLYLLYHQSIWFFFMKSLFLITSFKRSSTSQATATTVSFLGFTYMFSFRRLIINEMRNLWNSLISRPKQSTIELRCNLSTVLQHPFEENIGKLQGVRRTKSHQHHLNKVCVLMDTSAMLTWFLPGNIHVHFLLACMLLLTQRHSLLQLMPW